MKKAKAPPRLGGTGALLPWRKHRRFPLKAAHGLDCSLFARTTGGISIGFLFLQVLRFFNSLRSLPPLFTKRLVDD